jgi:hypothetical protein
MSQALAKMQPIKSGARVMFSPRRDVFVPGDVSDGVALLECVAQLCQAIVLRRFKSPALQTLQLDTDRVIIAIAATPPSRCAGMPCTLIAVHKLNQFTIPADQKMRRYFDAHYRLIVGVRVPVQLIGE